MSYGTVTTASTEPGMTTAVLYILAFLLVVLEFAGTPRIRRSAR
jgi:hypothetical protein